MVIHRGSRLKLSYSQEFLANFSRQVQMALANSLNRHHQFLLEQAQFHGRMVRDHSGIGQRANVSCNEGQRIQAGMMVRVAGVVMSVYHAGFLQMRFQLRYM